MCEYFFNWWLNIKFKLIRRKKNVTEKDMNITLKPLEADDDECESFF